MANCKFEFISAYKDCGLALPERKTRHSAGYDLAAAEDIIIPSYYKMMEMLGDSYTLRDLPNPIGLQEMADLTKASKVRPTLIPTGLKCRLEPGTYLELSVRSSTPLKQWIVLANSIGIVDADYYDNPDNEGHIYLQVINLSPIDIKIKKGDIIGQGVIKRYETIINDKACGDRVGGFGSTSATAINGLDGVTVQLDSSMFNDKIVIDDIAQALGSLNRTAAMSEQALQNWAERWNQI